MMAVTIMQTQSLLIWLPIGVLTQKTLLCAEHVRFQSIGQCKTNLIPCLDRIQIKPGLNSEFLVQSWSSGVGSSRLSREGGEELVSLRANVANGSSSKQPPIVEMKNCHAAA